MIPYGWICLTFSLYKYVSGKQFSTLIFDDISDYFLILNPGSRGLKDMNPFKILNVYNRLISRKAESIYTSFSRWEFLFHHTTVALNVHYLGQNIYLLSTAPINKILICFLS